MCPYLNPHLLHADTHTLTSSPSPQPHPPTPSNERIKHIRQYKSLMDQLSYFKLEELQWQYYHPLSKTKKIWSGRVTQHWAEKYFICQTYARSNNN
jgi:hypothetical protein